MLVDKSFEVLEPQRIVEVACREGSQVLEESRDKAASRDRLLSSARNFLQISVASYQDLQSARTYIEGVDRNGDHVEVYEPRLRGCHEIVV